LAPELWRGQRSFILPEKLGDLEKTEYLDQMKEKINKIKMLKQKHDAGFITQAQYLSRKTKIILGK